MGHICSCTSRLKKINMYFMLLYSATLCPFNFFLNSPIQGMPIILPFTSPGEKNVIITYGVFRF